MTDPSTPRVVARLASGPSASAGAGERVRVPDVALLSLVAGLPPVPRGSVQVDGAPLRGGPADRARRGVVAIVDAPVAPDVPVVDHLAARVRLAEARDAVAACPLLAGRGADPAGVLSGGERRALAWLRAAVLRPRVVVLRDAHVGLDAATAAWADDLLAEWLRAGAAVLEA